MKKILIPVDGSEGSDKALQFALSLIEKESYELILLNVQPSYNTPHVKRFFSHDEIQAYQEEMSNSIFEHEKKIMDKFSFPVHTKVRIGDPGNEICKEAKESAVDFIVMGYRGLGPVRRTILGSVASHVLHETTCPVMIVP
ncbi:universal stress protein [Dehalobacter sp. DCM]|uniref:universal stress protein n=1 Tax=Dehalobacter sp. DCM TaxID=2907827 RepID=UPI003082001D|nr:universal stress protein [Dehalobacter sp. DCM]